MLFLRYKQSFLQTLSEGWRFFDLTVLACPYFLQSCSSWNRLRIENQ